MNNKLTKKMIDDLASSLDGIKEHRDKFIVDGDYLAKLIDTSKTPQSGWSCPRCSRIYGPSVQICTPCNARVAVKENA